MEELDKELELYNKEHKLTAKQERFCQEYILCLNQTMAYQKAYGVEYETANKLASRLMVNDGVRVRIRELQEDLNEKYRVNAGFLIAKSIEVINLALQGERAEYCTKDGDILEGDKVTYDKRAVNDAIRNIASITGINAQTIKAQVEAKADVDVNLKASEIADNIFKQDKQEELDIEK